MLFFKRFFKQILLTALIGFVIRKLIASNDARAQRVGRSANKLVGGVFGLDENAQPVPHKRAKSITRSAASAAAGGAMSYFFDPTHGSVRRAKVRSFASERLGRSTERPLLPAATYSAVPAAQQVTGGAT